MLNDKFLILIVDDQIQNLELLEVLLVSQAYEIITAETGLDALAKIAVNPIDLVLLDVMMPGMNGYEVAIKIRGDERYRQLPIIMVTALRASVERIKGIDAGCDDFISKPIDKLELFARVRSLLKIKAYNDCLSIYRDELEGKKKESDNAREYAESIIDTIREPLLVLDQYLHVVKAGRSFYRVFKVKPEETLGVSIYDLGNRQWDIPRLRDLLETTLSEHSGFEDYEVEHDFSSIGKRTMLLNARQIIQDFGSGRIILLAIEDITERKLSEKKIQRMAFHDALTGLPNRILFADRLESALINARRDKKKVGIIMLDLDNFKQVNDTHGHDAGDILLKEVAMRLRAAIRKGDTVARLGGDEFALVLPNIEGSDGAARIAEKIMMAFKLPYSIVNAKFVVSTSIGLAIFPDDGDTDNDLLKKADIAMYQVKETGRAQFLFYEKLY